MTDPQARPSAPPAPGADVSPEAGWRRVARAAAEAMPVAEIERIWLFPPVRQEDREWGTAVVARRVVEGRLRVYTGRYALVVRGRERGQGQVVVEEVGETPDAVLPEVLRGVRARAGEADDPVEVAPAAWYPGDDEPPPAG